MTVSNLIEGPHTEPACVVTCVTLCGGYDSEGKHAGKFLKVGERYTVTFVDIDMSWTKIELKEFPGEWFEPTLFSGLVYHEFSDDVEPRRWPR